MSDFHDPDLRRQLGRLSGPYPDDNAAFAAWQRRVGQARRRRAVAWTTGAALSLIMVTVAFAAAQEPGRQSVVPQKSSETSDRVSVSIATTETKKSTTSESIAPEIIAPTAIESDTTPTTEVAGDSSMPAPDSTAPAGSATQGSTSKGSTSKGSAGTTSSAVPKSSQAPQPPPTTQTATQTVTSIGGSITVRQDGDQLTIIAMDPASRFRPDRIDQTGHRVGLTFRSSTHRSEISVRLSNGTIAADVIEVDAHEESVPSDTSGDNHGGGGGGGDG